MKHTHTPFWALGIDPGSKGALAALRSDLSEQRILKMPMLDKAIDTVEVRAFLEGLKQCGDVRHALLEKSQVMPSQGAVSGFTYGRNYGVLLTCLEFLDIPFTETSPSKWKLAVIGAAAAGPSAKKKGDADDGKGDGGRSAHKRAVKALAVLTARRMFPSAGPFLMSQDGPAEAMLMAEAARRLVLHGSMGDCAKPAPAKKATEGEVQ